MGRCEYKADIDVKINISPDLLGFEMWEKSQKADSKFLKDVSHVGKISEDLKSIKAVWT